MQNLTLNLTVTYLYKWLGIRLLPIITPPGFIGNLLFWKDYNNKEYSCETNISKNNQIKAKIIKHYM